MRVVVLLPHDCWLRDEEVAKVLGGRKIYRSRARDRYYTWDSLHGEIEVYNRAGQHLGVTDCEHPDDVQPGTVVKGRRIDVS